MKPGFNLDSLPGSLPPNLIPEDANIQSVQELAQRTLETGSLDANVLQATALWRDHLAMTGQVRTFYSNEKIAEVWNNRAKTLHISDIRTQAGRVMKPVPASSWVDVPFTFTTNPEGGLVGNCTGAASFVLDKDGNWVIWMLVTILENFVDHGHPDVPRLADNTFTNGEANGVHAHDKNLDIDNSFDVVVIGAGQCGLSVAGRLGALGLSYVLLEKRPYLGNNWIGRYETVRQHTVREYNNLPFERTWKPDDPILLPGKIVAEGFENYVKKYGINLWTNAETTGADWEPESRTWTLNVTVNGQEKRRLRCQHLIISIGAGFGVDNDPKFPGTDQYQGVLLHSGSYKHSRDWVAKDGVVIGSGTMAHDIAEDMYRAGLRSVHMIQRNKTCVYPIEWVIKGQAGMYEMKFSLWPPSLVVPNR
jgi:hypothetical protein